MNVRKDAYNEVISRTGLLANTTPRLNILPNNFGPNPILNPGAIQAFIHMGGPIVMQTPDGGTEVRDTFSGFRLLTSS